MSVAAETRHITRGREARVSEGAFADEVAGRRSLWWAGVPGLDPLHPLADRFLAAQVGTMVCAAHVLGPDLPGDNRFRRGASRLASDFFRWLTDNRGDMDAYLRRMALRTACDTPGLNPDDVLDSAKALYAAVAGR